MISMERAIELLDSFRDSTILTIGDLMLDRYVFGTVDRISPEAPVPVVLVTEEAGRPGGSANVAANIAALGGRAAVCGLVGRDSDGERVLRLLADAGIDVEGVLQADGIRTTVKTRVIAERQQIVRVDHESRVEDMEAVNGAFRELVARMIEKADGVIIEDYGKGVVTQGTVDAALAGAKARGIPIGFDPKDNHELRIDGVALATPNYREACRASGQPERALGDSAVECRSLSEAGRLLSERWRPDLLLITLGPHGMYLLPRGGLPVIIPTRAREVYDVSGAGDTVIAAALTALVAGATHLEAAEFANHAAGVVVGKVGTAPCRREELIRALAEA